MLRAFPENRDLARDILICEQPGGMLALAHGTNDAQKTMGVITLALVANGNLHKGAGVPQWVVISAATAIALGTYSGGWRIIKTMGTRIIKMTRLRASPLRPPAPRRCWPLRTSAIRSRPRT